MRSAALFVALWMAATAAAQDRSLAALHTTLLSLRAPGVDPDTTTFGAPPELTTAKHQLRDWIEAQLNRRKDLDDERIFADQINMVLKAVSVPGKEDDQNLLGSLGEVRVRGESGLLTITTSVGIL